MKSTRPVRLWISIALYYFNPEIHEKKLKLSISMKVGLSDYTRQMLPNEIHKSCPIMDFKCTILL